MKQNRRIRPSPARTVEDARWVKDKRGKWRHVIDEPTETDYCFRRREKPGWFHAAKVSRR
jgi:hypothetical protein